MRQKPDQPEITVVVGSGRSGTTYLARMLKECLDIGFSAEAKFIVPIYRKLRRFGSLEDPANLTRLAGVVHDDPVFTHLHNVLGIPSRPEEIVERVESCDYTGVLYAAFRLIADKRGQSRLGYKDPTDAINLPLLAELMPTARFVHIIRDGRDVASSLLKFSWGATNLYSGARYWSRIVAIGQRHGSALGDRYFELRFEDLILDTENVATALGRFVNQGRYPEQVRALVERINETKQPGVAYAWKRKMDSDQRRICEAVAGDMLRACRYSTEFEGQSGVSAVQAAYYLGTDFVTRAKNRLTRESGLA